MQEKFEFKLENPLKTHGQVDGNNELVTIDKLYLQAPTYKHREKTIAIKQAYLSAEQLRSMKIFATGVHNAMEKVKNEITKDVKEKEEEKELPEEDIRNVLFRSGEDCINLSKFFDKFINLFSSKNGVCFRDEDCTDLIKPHELNEMSEIDLEDLVVEYIRVFFIPSWKRNMI